jgi:hypothetical protein
MTLGWITFSARKWITFKALQTPWAGPRSSHRHRLRQPQQQKGLGSLGRENTTFLAVVDLEGLLKTPRTGHGANAPPPAGLVTFVAE